MSKLKEIFRKIPTALQKQILIRGALGVIAFLIFIFIMIYMKEFFFGLPCIVLALFMIVNTTQLLYNCAGGKFIVIKGVCKEVEKTAIRRWVKSISMQTKDLIVVLPIRYRVKAPSIGDEITVYLPEKAPVYDRDGSYCIYSFYALEINRKV